MSLALRTMTAVAIAVASIAGFAAGCGSSQPAYCDDKADLQQSVSDLKSVNIEEDGVSALQSQAKQVESDANALVESAQSEFGPETDALKSAVSTLGTAVEDAAAAPSTQSIAAVGNAVSGVQSALTRVSDAVSSQC